MITAQAQDKAGNISYHQIQVTVLSPEGVNYFYDKNGNLMKKVTQDKTTTYAYDYENRLTKVTQNGETVASYTYDGEGKRISSTEDGTTTHYLYDGLLPIIERNSSGQTTATYTRGLSLGGGIGGIISRHASEPAYYHYDALGSVVNLTDSTGSLVQSNIYEAFGNIISQTSTIQNNLFSTKPYNASSGLYYFGARYYDPTIGRFITADPLGMVTAGPNLYSYVTNDPVNFIDPMGLFKIGSEEGKFLLRLFKEVGGEPFRLQWRYGGKLYHIADSIKWGFHYANETAHYYWNRMVVWQNGKWIAVSYPLLGKTAGVLGEAALVVGAGYVGWKIGSWIADLPVPNLINDDEWDVTFGNAFVPSSWNWNKQKEKNK